MDYIMKLTDLAKCIHKDKDKCKLSREEVRCKLYNKGKCCVDELRTQLSKEAKNKD